MRALKRVLLSLSLLCFSAPLLASYGAGLGGGETIAVHNRILLKIGSKTITVVDLKKKMDLLIYRSYPSMAASDQFRCQFYLANWKPLLQTMIDDELILADALEKKISVTDGEVREELERLFGPDVVLNIEKAGLKRKEAWEMLKSELICQKILGPMVRIKAISDVPPSKVRKTYEAYLAANPPQGQWNYRVVTISGGEDEERNRVADAAYKLLTEQNIPFKQVVSKLEEEKITPSSVFVRVSDEYVRQDDEISLSHKAVLQTLNIGGFSAPQIAKVSGAKEVNRLFFLKEFVPAQTPSFAELETKFKSELTRAAIGQRSKEYLGRLREHFGVNENYLNTLIPEDFVPFSLN